MRLWVLLLLLSPVIAQAGVPAWHARNDSSRGEFIRKARALRDLDLIDLVHIAIKHNFVSHTDSVKRANARVHGSVIPAAGYTQITGFAGVISGTMAFHVSKEHNLNQSNINLNLSYSQRNQAVFYIQPNIWTKYDKWNITADYRIMHYPQTTYGLGGHTRESDGYVIDAFYLKLYQTFMRHVYKDLYLGFGYDLDYHFRIQELTTNTATDFKRYDGNVASISSGFTANILYDSRRNALNPRGGFYANIIYRLNYHDLGSDVNYSSLIADLRAYVPLTHDRRHLLALWSYNWLTFDANAPYLDMPSTGWDTYSNTGRGYIQSRFRGKNMLYFEAEYRFPILRNGFLSGVVFANAQSFTDYPSNRFTTIAPAAGGGLRFKLNKHSGANLCLDYAVGLNGSNGLSVNIGEVF